MMQGSSPNKKIIPRLVQNIDEDSVKPGKREQRYNDTDITVSGSALAETKPIDFLIVGFGLAGGILAWELLQRGLRVVVVDDGETNASQVAAGLINPITGQRFAKTSDIDTLLPVARVYYADLESFFKRRFYFEKPMRRLLGTDKEVDQCRKRLDDDDYRGYLGSIVAPSDSGGLFGYLEQRQTGYLWTRPLLACLEDYFRFRSSYRQIRFDYADLRLNPVLQWRDYRPRAIIFCEGFRVRDNPWFSWLPMRPAKGEILTLEHNLPIPDELVNGGGHWLVPVDSERIRLGATFDRKNIDLRITEEAKIDLITAGERFFPGLKTAQMIVHEAGIRPCTEDRRPFIGKHPRLPQLHIFNGFGAKGSVMIPWYGRRFADFLLNGGTLPTSCNIQRYESPLFPGS